MNEAPSNEKVHILTNGRVYKIFDTGQPYQEGEYPSGGLVIKAFVPQTKEWLYIDNSPDDTCVQNFLKAMSRRPAETR